MAQDTDVPIKTLVAEAPLFLQQFVDSLGFWNVVCAVLFPVIWAVIMLWRNGSTEKSAEFVLELIVALLLRAATGWSLPAAPAFLSCAFYPSLIPKLQEVRFALVIAAFGVIVIVGYDIFTAAKKRNQQPSR